MEKLTERLIYDRVKNLSADTGTNNLRRAKVKPGRVERIRIVAVENKTTAYTKVRVGIWDGAIFHNYFEEVSPTAANLYFTVDEMILREGMQLQAELQGCTSGDDIEMFIYGEWEKEK